MLKTPAKNILEKNTMLKNKAAYSKKNNKNYSIENK